MNRSLLNKNADGTLRSFVIDFLEEFLHEDGILDPVEHKYWESALFEPALDILQRPGKAFRSEILKACWELAGGDAGEQPQELIFVVELLHTGSLIIDDIEDDSATRRGEPTLHRRYGVPIALNTGNWLYFLPLSLLSRIDLPKQMALEMYTDVSDALVLSHQGQALDLAIHVGDIRQSDMQRMVAHSTRMKTGTLMRLAARLGARAAGADPRLLDRLSRFGADLGVALQMLDDWSGIHSPEHTHKGIEDIRHGRLTWPWAWLAEIGDEIGFAGLLHDVSQLRIDWEAEQLILRMRSQLQDVAPGIINRHLQMSFARLERELPPSAALEALRSTVGVLEKAYG